MKRAEDWLVADNDNEIIKDYIVEYDKAFVRLLYEYFKSNNEVFYNSYFQISYIKNGKKDFKSFKIYNDEEERGIRDGIPNIPTHKKFKR